MASTVTPDGAALGASITNDTEDSKFRGQWLEWYDIENNYSLDIFLVLIHVGLWDNTGLASCNGIISQSLTEEFREH